MRRRKNGSRNSRRLLVVYANVYRQGECGCRGPETVRIFSSVSFHFQALGIEERRIYITSGWIYLSGAYLLVVDIC